MSSRIGFASVIVESVQSTQNNPLNDGWEGMMELGGDEVRFSTNIGEIAEGSRYYAVYEKTETITGEPIVQIHEVFDNAESIIN